MNFEEKLKTYAELIIGHGLNVQEGQRVNIAAEVCHREFAYQLAEAAYERGAKLVELDLIEPRMGRLRIQKSKPENLDFVPGHIPVKYTELVDSNAANLRIIGSEDPTLLKGLDPKLINRAGMASKKAMRYFYEEGIGKSKVHWTIAAAATEAWGQRLFPDMGAAESCAALWEAIFKATRADKANCLELWEEHNNNLHTRGKKLSEMKISELHFQGPGTDLRVGLSQKALFKGGSDESPLGAHFEPNIPTEEVFTTPDLRRTEGTVKATRPFLVNGTLIEDLEMTFKEGKLVDFKASAGEETFQAYIDTDEGSRYLGEVALVGIDSPIYQSGIVFEEILFDENAACHIAIGSAYKFCMDGGESMDEKELAEFGVNESLVHTDMMISSEEVNVSATTYDGKTVELLKNGEWIL